MEQEQKDSTAVETSENNVTKENDSSVTPTEQPEEASKLTEDIDPRIVNIIGEDKIKTAFTEKQEDKEASVDEKKEVETEPEKKEENQEQKVEEKKVEVEQEVKQTETQEPKPSRLDKRLAKLYIHNLHLLGEENIPTEEEIYADLQQYPQEEKIEAMHMHRLKAKELAGEKVTGNDLDEEDLEAIEDAKREDIRQEILAEIEEKRNQEEFVTFLDKHPELLEGNKEYDPKLAKAVETLWEGGMSIKEAYGTITEQFEAVKQAQIEEEKKSKNVALSGVLSGTGQLPTEDKKVDWEYVQKMQKENPQEYRKMLSEGKFNHLM